MHGFSFSLFFFLIHSQTHSNSFPSLFVLSILYQYTSIECKTPLLPKLHTRQIPLTCDCPCVCCADGSTVTWAEVRRRITCWGFPEMELSSSGRERENQIPSPSHSGAVWHWWLYFSLSDLIVFSSNEVGSLSEVMVRWNTVGSRRKGTCTSLAPLQSSRAWWSWWTTSGRSHCIAKSSYVTQSPLSWLTASAQWVTVGEIQRPKEMSRLPIVKFCHYSSK